MVSKMSCSQDEALWACLAGMACASRDLATAEVAYAAINEVSVCVSICLSEFVWCVGTWC